VYRGPVHRLRHDLLPEVHLQPETISHQIRARLRRDFLRGDAEDAPVPLRGFISPLLRSLPTPPPYAAPQAPQHRLRPLHPPQQEIRVVLRHGVPGRPGGCHEPA